MLSSLLKSKFWRSVKQVSMEILIRKLKRLELWCIGHKDKNSNFILAVVLRARIVDL
jgi:hypothetical protein